jgi:hypothetical protein
MCGWYNTNPIRPDQQIFIIGIIIIELKVAVLVIGGKNENKLIAFLN